MAAKGKVSINTDTVNQSLSKIANSCAVLESDISGKIPGNFQVLSDAGLLPSALTKLEKQISDLVTVHKSLSTQIATHLESVAQDENDLLGELNGGKDGGKSGGNRSGGSSGGGTDVDDQDDGKKVNAKKLIEAIPKIDDKTFVELLNFLNVNKNKKTSLIDLLFDTSKSEELFVLLRKAFGETKELENVKLDDYKEVQKVLLDAIFSKETIIKELSDESILIAKEYLVGICKANNINPSDLLLDEKYRDLLKEGLQNLYDGKDVNSTDEETIKKFRKYIDSVASKNNMDADKLLTSNLRLLL